MTPEIHARAPRCAVWYSTDTGHDDVELCKVNSPFGGSVYVFDNEPLPDWVGDH